MNLKRPSTKNRDLTSLIDAFKGDNSYTFDNISNSFIAVLYNCSHEVFGNKLSNKIVTNKIYDRNPGLSKGYFQKVL